jgi:tripeptide aminopeptidase
MIRVRDKLESLVSKIYHTMEAVLLIEKHKMTRRKNMRAYERLIKYTKYPTVSDGKSPTCPSTPTQLEFGKALVSEMLEIGIKDAFMDKDGYVYGTIPATKADGKGPVIGFIAHMDVASDAPCDPVNTRVINNYQGGDIELSEGIVMPAKEYKVLENCIGHDLLVTDGKTLLGGDNKAGIAEILTMAEHLIKHPEIPHGTIKIGFTPDEEIGRGANLFDVKGFGADYAYTVDGGAFGEVEYETFSAFSADITIKGVSIHPGVAKNKLVNASQVAMEFNGMLPSVERPEHTEEREGFYHLIEMSGTVEEAKLSYILRDHEDEIVEERVAVVEDIAAYLNKKYGEGTVTVEIKEWYRNMKKVIKEHWHLIENAYKGVELAGGTPYSIPIRGGTDGSRLSFMGLPCPNLGTGNYNAHSRFEFASIQSMDKVVESLIEIAKLYTDYEV